VTAPATSRDASPQLPPELHGRLLSLPAYSRAGVLFAFTLSPSACARDRIVFVAETLFRKLPFFVITVAGGAVGDDTGVSGESSRTADGLSRQAERVSFKLVNRLQ
jgi:hypothetical protein